MNDQWEWLVSEARRHLTKTRVGPPNVPWAAPVIIDCDVLVAMADEIDRLREIEARELRRQKLIADYARDNQANPIVGFCAEIVEGLLGKPPDPPAALPSGEKEAAP